MRAVVASIVLSAAAVPAAAGGCTVQPIAELKVTMEGPRPLLDTTIDDKPARFIVDSGAFFSTISPAAASDLGLHAEMAPGLVIRGIGGAQAGEVATARHFGMAGAQLHGIQFVVGGSAFGPGIAGLLGQNVLGLADVEYDLGHGMIRLMRAKGCGDANLAYWASGRPWSMIEIEPRSREQPHTIGRISINGVALRAIFDTGADTTLLTKDAARRAGIVPDGPGVVASGVSRGIGRGTVQTWLAPVASVRVGDEEVRHTKLQFADQRLDNGDLLLGADFFLSHRIYVDNAHRRLFFTYDGGPVFGIVPRQVVATDGTAVAVPTASAEPAPADAAAFARRGAARASKGDLTGALADLDHAVAGAPQEARYRVQRAEAYLGLHQPQLAAADLDQALTLEPGGVDALLMRAQLRIATHDQGGALADLDAAVTALPPGADARLAIGQAYERLDAFDRAVAQIDLWIDAHRDDSRRPVALGSRCWSRALGNLDPERAMADCNAALRSAPKAAAFLEGRALVRLRTGDATGALADADAALAVDARKPWALYERGLAEARLGQAERGRADIAAAEGMAPAVVERAKRLGLVA